MIIIWLGAAICALRTVEFFEIYDDRIISRWVFGITNMTYKSDIENIILSNGYSGGRFSDTTKCWFLIDQRPKAAYSFVTDGEGLPLWYNKKRYCMRIPKTEHSNMVVEILKKEIDIRAL